MASMWQAIVLLLYVGIALLALLLVPVPSFLTTALDRARAWLVITIFNARVFPLSKTRTLTFIQFVFIISMILVTFEYKFVGMVGVS